MIIQIIIAHRKESYKGEHGLEALACATQYDVDENPDYIQDKLEKAQDKEQFSAIILANIEVNEKALYELLYPNKKIFLQGEIK